MKQYGNGMNSEIKKGNVLINFCWRLAELVGAQGISFLISIVLARLLLPSEYGTIALVSVFISIVDVFVTKGFGTALIQKKDADSIDFSTVFFFNMCFTIILYIATFFAAPYVASFYKMPELCNLIRVLSIRVILSGVNSVQYAYVSKRMEFKKFFNATIVGTIVSGIIGIFLAYSGYGVWALALQYLSNAFIDTLILWCIVKWRPVCCFSWNRLSKLFSYGWKILGAGLLGSLYVNLQTLIIGKLESSSDLAYYNKGKQFPQTIISSISTAIEGVMFPAMANQQESREMVRETARYSITMSAYVMFPITLGMFAISKPLIILLLTEKWMGATFFLQISCITFLFWPIQTVNLQVIKAMGKGGTFLALEFVKKIIGIVGILLGVCFGAKGIIISEAVVSIIALFIDMMPNKKTISYGIKEQFFDVLPSFMLAMGMSFCVYCIGEVLQQPTFIQILAQILIGCVIYILGSVVFKIKSFDVICIMVKKIVRKSKDTSDE